MDLKPISKEVRPRNLAHQSVVLAGATGASQVLLAGMYILVARLAGPENYGTIITAVALGMSLSIFLDFGSNALWIREGASGRLSALDLGHRATSKIKIALLVLSFWTLVASFVPISGLWVSGPIALSILLSQTSQVGPRRLGRIGIVSTAVLSDRLVGALSVALLIYIARVNPTTALWVSLMLGSLTGAVLSWILTPRYDRLSLRSARLLNPWRNSGYYGLAGIAAGIQSFELQVIAGVGGSETVGLYGAVNRWTQPLGLLTNAFASASVPFVAASSSWVEAWPTVRRALWLPMTAMGGALAAFAIAPVLVPVLLGDSYGRSVIVLQILALGTIPGIANQSLAVFLQARGHDRIVSYILFSSAIVQLLSVAALALNFGATGAAVASAGAQAIALFGLTLAALSVRRRQQSVILR